jgi:hypothetical protein
VAEFDLLGSRRRFWCYIVGHIWQRWEPPILGKCCARCYRRCYTNDRDPNPLDPTNKYFRKCLKGHTAYSVSFHECPSCKVAARYDSF